MHQLLEEQDAMEMGTIPQVAIFARDQIPNFVTRLPQTLNKKLEMPRVDHPVRQVQMVLRVGIGQRERNAHFADSSLAEAAPDPVRDVVFPAIPTVIARCRDLNIFRAAFHPDEAWSFAHFRPLSFDGVTKRVYSSRG